MLDRVSPIYPDCCKQQRCQVRPSPALMAQIEAKYTELIQKKLLPATMSFSGQTTNPALNIPGGGWTGISITAKGNPGSDLMSVDISIA